MYVGVCGAGEYKKKRLRLDDKKDKTFISRRVCYCDASVIVYPFPLDVYVLPSPKT